MIVESDEESLFARKYAKLITNRFDDLVKYFSDDKPVFSKEHREKLDKLQSSVNFFYGYCTSP